LSIERCDRRRIVSIDNDVYNRDAAGWRDENNHLSMLVPLTPPRVAYMRDVLENKLGLDLAGKPTLDIGCGGGLVAEAMTQLGCRVTGVDPSAASLETARAHAAEVCLEIDYRHGGGEDLPCNNASFDIAYCLDVLEHVADLDRVIAEVARVLKPGGVFIYDTINRTFISKLVIIKIPQDWSWTSVFPPNLHRWEMFIKPPELKAVLRKHNLENREVVGFPFGGNPLVTIRMLRKRKRGEISFGDVGRYMASNMKINGDLSASYGGYAIRK
jgi:2-polyprenyl-6-hydroxyphenyl methylase/3-demethylubiquinone-9 3-methyltransferase